MARLNWKQLPKTARNHLYDALRTREINADDVVKLQKWIDQDPEVPEDDD